MFVVAGVTGNTGRVVAETLLARGEAVRVLVRSAEKGKAWKEKGADVAVVELTDGARLAEALTGAKGAYLLVPPAVTEEHVLPSQRKVIAGLVEGVKKSGVPHVVFLSSVAAHLPSGTGPILITHEAERALSAVTKNVTFVRAAYFMENLGGSLAALPHGIFPTFLKAGASIPMIATRDIGTTAAQALLEGPNGTQIIELEGPARVSPEDVVVALRSITGKDVALQVGPESAVEEAFVGFGMSRDMARLYHELIHGVNTGHVGFEGKGARSVQGKTPVRDVLAAMLPT